MAIQPEHVDQLLEKMREHKLPTASATSLLKAINNPQKVCVVAVEKGEIKGFSYGNYDGGDHASGGYTYSFERRKGIGTLLFKSKIRRLFRLGAPQITCVAASEESSRMVERVIREKNYGFEKDGVWYDIYPRKGK